MRVALCFRYRSFVERARASVRTLLRPAVAEEADTQTTLDSHRWRAKPRPPPILDSILDRRKPYSSCAASATAAFGSFRRTRAALGHTLQCSRTSMSLPVPTMSKALEHTALAPAWRAGLRALPPL